MISVVIPSYNRKDCVLALLGDLRSQQGVEFEVIVVDDASPDGTAAAVRDCFPEVILFVNETNGGPCVSRNRGIRAARGEIVVGLDSDVTVSDPRLLARVEAAFALSPESSGFAFRIFKPDGVTDDAPRWWHPVPIERGCDRRFETDYFSGTGYAFRRNAMIEAGLYPEILYMHYEEVELAYRIVDRGGAIHYRPDLAVVHHANPVSRRSEINIFYKPRNQVLLAVGCLPVWQAVRYLGIRLPYQFLSACRGGHVGRFMAAMKSAIALGGIRLRNRRPLRKQAIRSIRGIRRAAARIGK